MYGYEFFGEGISLMDLSDIPLFDSSRRVEYTTVIALAIEAAWYAVLWSNLYEVRNSIVRI
jgi:hypothetical protein